MSGGSREEGEEVEVMDEEGAEGEWDEDASNTEPLEIAEVDGEDTGEDTLERGRVRETMAVAAESSGETRRRRVAGAVTAGAALRTTSLCRCEGTVGRSGSHFVE